jgi:hypothetical protein
MLERPQEYIFKFASNTAINGKGRIITLTNVASPARKIYQKVVYSSVLFHYQGAHDCIEIFRNNLDVQNLS